MRAAWHVEAFARSKKLPKLKDVLISDRAPSRRKMSAEELEALTRQWLAGARNRRGV